MDRLLKSLSAGIFAANPVNEFLNPQTLLFRLLEGDYTSERPGLDNENAARELEINESLRREQEECLSTLNHTFEEMHKNVMKIMSATVAKQVQLHLERDKLRRNSEENRIVAVAKVIKVATDIILHSTSEQNRTSGSSDIAIDRFPSAAQVGNPQQTTPRPESDSLCSTTHPHQQLLSTSQQRRGTSPNPAILSRQKKRKRIELPHENMTTTTKRPYVKHLVAEHDPTNAKKPRGRPRKKPANPPKTTPGNEDTTLKTCVGSSEKVADCITINSASEPRVDVEVPNTEDSHSLDEASAPKKLGEVHDIMATASEIKCTDSNRNPATIDGRSSAENSLAATTLLQLREGPLDPQYTKKAGTLLPVL